MFSLQGEFIRLFNLFVLNIIFISHLFHRLIMTMLLWYFKARSLTLNLWILDVIIWDWVFKWSASPISCYTLTEGVINRWPIYLRLSDLDKTLCIRIVLASDNISIGFFTSSAYVMLKTKLRLLLGPSTTRLICYVNLFIHLLAIILF